MNDNARLVYSSDPSKNQKCPKCREIVAACRCVPEEAVVKCKFVAIIRLEKQGRGGKTVTVIDGLPKQELFLRELTTKLKKKCGSGGTYSLEGKEGLIEIQGDKRDTIVKHLEADGIRVKGDFKR